MADSGFNSYNTGETDTDATFAWAEQFFGGSAFTDALRYAIEPAIQGAMTSQFGVPGRQAQATPFGAAYSAHLLDTLLQPSDTGDIPMPRPSSVSDALFANTQPDTTPFTLPYGSSTIFGTQDVGLNLVHALRTQSVDATLLAAGEAEDSVRRESLNQWYRALYPDMSEGEIESKIDAPLSATGAIQKMVFNAQHQPDRLMAGLREGIQYLGTAPYLPGTTSDEGIEAQLRIRQEASTMAEAVQRDALVNPEEYGGLTGEEKGQVFAELARTGAFNAARKEAADIEDPGAAMDQLGKQTVEMTRQASQAIKAFKHLFQGSVPEVLDQINGLMGTDVMQTFSEGGRELAQTMVATGMATGYTPDQMISFSGMSRQLSQAKGLDPWGSVASGTLAAQLVDIHTKTEGGGRFVNEQRFRENMIRRTTGAQESGISRDIAGAFALIQSSVGQEAADKFIDDLGDDTIRGTSDVVSAANTALGPESAVTGMDLKNASYSAAAETYRAEGGTGMLALRSNMEFVNRIKRDSLRSSLHAAGVSDSDVSDIMGSLDDKSLTTDNVMDAVEGSIENAPAFEGAWRRRATQMAQGMTMGNNSFESDAMLTAITNDEAYDNMQQQIADSVALQETFKGRGNVSGLGNLQHVIDALEEADGADISMRDVFRAATGSDNVDIPEEQMRPFLGKNIDEMIAVANTEGAEDRLQKFKTLAEGGSLDSPQGLTGQTVLQVLSDILTAIENFPNEGGQ